MKNQLKELKRGLLSTIAASMCAVTAISTPALVQADGNETLGTPSIAVAGGSNVVSAGVGLKLSGTGTINLNVPATATIKQVLLYWEGLGYNYVPQTSTTGVRELLVNDKIASGIEIGRSIPHPQSIVNFKSYRADITGLNIVKPGSNSINVSGKLKQAPEFDGASIVVIYDEPTGVAYGGRAVGIESGIGPNKTVVGDTGSLPPQGGDLKPASLVNAALFGLANAKVVESRALGAGGVTTSTVGVANVNALFSAIGLAADLIESKATASCTATVPKVSASSRFARLRLLGIDKPISFAPNTTLLNLPGVLKIVVNEQTQSVVGGVGKIKVNAVHVTSPLLPNILPIDVVIASAAAEVNCAVSAPSNIELRDGFDSAFAVLADPSTQGYPYLQPLITTVPQVFTFAPVAFPRVAAVKLIVAAASAHDPIGDSTRIRISVDGTVVFSQLDLLDQNQGLAWDDLTVNVPVAANATSVKVELLSEKENFQWVATGIVLPKVPPAGNAFSGQATVAKIAYKDHAAVTVADTGALPSTGGSLDATVNNLALTTGVLLTSGTAVAKTAGAGSKSESVASIESLNLVGLGLAVNASVVKSTAKATCDSLKKATVTGASEIANLTVQGKAIVIAPNLKIPLPLGGVLYVNEQIKTQTAPNIASITVNALRLALPAQAPIHEGLDLLSVTLASSHADIVCR